MGKVATSPLPSRGSPPLQSGGKNQKWPTSGQSGYVTPAVSRIPTTAERGGEIRSGPLVGKVATPPLPSQGSPSLQSRWAKSEVAHLWAKWLCHPYRLGDPHHCTAGGGIRSGPLVGKVARSPLPSRGSPPLHSGAAKSEVAHLWEKWLRHPCRLGDPHHCRAGGESEVAHLWAKWLGHPYRLGDPHHCRAEGQNQKWPTCGQSGYAAPAVSGIPTTAERGGGGGAKSEVAHKWAKWLRHPCRLGDPHHCGGGGGGQKWPTCGQSGYVTPAVSGIPTSAERGAKSEVAQKWAKWLRHPCRLGDAHSCKAGGKIGSGPLVGKAATSPLPSRGSPPLQSGGAKSEVAHLWAKWLRHPRRLRDPHHCRAGGGGGRFRSGPQVGKVATPPLPSRGSPTLQSGGGNQKWPTCGLSGYVTPAVSGIPTTAERGGGGSEVAHLWAKWLRHPCRLRDPHHCRAGGGGEGSEVAHKWAKWLRHPCRLGDPHRFRAGGEIRSGPLVG